MTLWENLSSYYIFVMFGIWKDSFVESYDIPAILIPTELLI